MERGHVRVILDVQREGVPISGSILGPSGVERRFHGWLELADAVEAARAGTLTYETVRSEPQAAERVSAVPLS